MVDSYDKSELITDDRKSELNQIVAGVHDSVGEKDDLESPKQHKE